MRHGKDGAQTFQINVASLDVMTSRHDQVPRCLCDRTGLFLEQPDDALLRSYGVPVSEVEDSALRFPDDRHVRLFREGAQGSGMPMIAPRRPHDGIHAL